MYCSFLPLDFTFVCPTEIIAFFRSAEEFAKLGVQILGVSVDSPTRTWLGETCRGPKVGWVTSSTRWSLI